MSRDTVRKCTFLRSWKSPRGGQYDNTINPLPASFPILGILGATKPNVRTSISKNVVNFKVLPTK